MNLPISCPSCHSTLAVKSLVCQQCATSIEGLFTLPLLVKLSKDEQAFILGFVRSSGSLKEMSKQLSLSYPTVRNMLDDLIAKINLLDNQ
ncbi:MAG: DUF2089 domain-containing protein [Bacteroidetes bacterium]|nr:DUF2089 domain-containing protein [Bacteroidota bacterium]